MDYYYLFKLRSRILYRWTLGLNYLFTFLLRIWNFGMCWARGAWRDRLPTGHWVSDKLPCAETSHTCYYILTVGEEWVLCDPTWEGESRRKPAYGFLQTLSVFFFPWSACVSSLHGCNNPRHEHNSMLNAESPSSKSPNVEVVLRSLKPFRTSGAAPQWRALWLSNRHPGWLFLKSTFQPEERRKGTKEILSPTGI